MPRGAEAGPAGTDTDCLGHGESICHAEPPHDLHSRGGQKTHFSEPMPVAVRRNGLLPETGWARAWMAAWGAAS